MTLTEGALSPLIFRQWSAIALLAGALERRVWLRVGERVVFPNLYTFLVAPPGTGKLVIEIARELWGEVKAPGTREGMFHVAPDSMTKAALIDALAKAKCSRVLRSGPPYIYHSLLVAAEELSILVPAYDMEYIGALNGIYNNKALHEEARRHGPKQEVKIEFPQLNLLVGAQPSYMAELFPESAWSSGLSRRVIMVHGTSAPLRSAFYIPEVDPGLKPQMISRLAAFGQMYGEIGWSAEAQAYFDKWYMNGQEPMPGHSKLQAYNSNRALHLYKLIVVASVSRQGGLGPVQVEDVKRAMSWLFDAEAKMPDIFREMVGKSDRQVIEDLHYAVSQKYLKDKKPVIGAFMMDFLSARVPSDKTDVILKTAERSNIIARVGGTQDLWVPRPKQDWGVE